jgi:hypothetical protein
MKYYVYVSDAKVEMLYAQIPRAIRDKIVAELKIDLKVVSLSLKGNPTDETRYSKLRVVSDYLDKEGVGTVDAPHTYFRGSVPMKWGRFGETVYFTGASRGTVIGLGGSARHVIGAAPNASSELLWSSSLQPALVEFLAGQSEKLDDAGEGAERAEGVLPVGGNHPGFPADVWVPQLFQIWRRQPGIAEPLEFLARRLLQSDGGGERGLLGTPIYVAARDE